MKIVILDGYTTNPGDLSWDFLNEFGTYTVYDRTPKEKIVERAQGCDIIITNKTPIDARTIAALPELKFITLLSTGFNVVDVDFAREKGIPVSNVPCYSTSAVAQLVFAFILEHTNRVALHSEAGPRRRMEQLPELLLLEVPADRASGQDYRHHRIRQDRQGGRKNRRGFRHGCARQFALRKSRRLRRGGQIR